MSGVCLQRLNKPAGLVVHPSPGHLAGTLVHGLLKCHVERAKLTINRARFNLGRARIPVTENVRRRNHSEGFSVQVSKDRKEPAHDICGSPGCVGISGSGGGEIFQEFSG